MKNTSSVKIPAYVYIFFLALPVVFGWDSGFFNSFATLIAWFLTVFMGFLFVVMSLMFFFGKADEIIKDNPKMEEYTKEQQIKGLFISGSIIFLMYTLGHENLAFFYFFFITGLRVYVKILISNKK